jgi:hypothetical protein
MRNWFVMLFLLCAVVLGTANRASAQNVAWKAGGVSAATGTGYQIMNTYEPYWYGYYCFQYNTNVTDDGAGGMIVSWVGYSYNYYVCVQRIKADGTVAWNTTTGALAYGYNYNFMYMCNVVGDNAGGAYVGYTVYDPNTGYYRPCVQHMSSTGSPLWGTYGYFMNNSPYYTYQSYPYFLMMDKDGNGGAVVSYYTNTSTSYQYGTLYAADVYGTNSTPTYRWGPTAVFTHSSTEYYYYASTSGYNYYCNPTICSDGAGGAWLSWQTYNGGYRIRYARVNGSGSVIVSNYFTNPSGNYIYTGGSYGSSPYGSNPLRIFTDKSGGCWVTYPGYYYMSPYATHINSAGSLVGSYMPCRYSYYLSWGQFCPDDNGGLYMVGWDYANTYYQYLRHLSSTGSITADVNLDNYYYPSYPYQDVASDGSGNALVTWNNGSQYGIYVQKYSSTGATMWGSSPKSIGTSGMYNYGSAPQIKSDGAAGALIAWNAYNNGSYYYTVAAQRLSDTAAVPHSAASASVINVGTVRVTPSTVPTISYSAVNSSLNVISDVGSAPAVQAPLTISSTSSVKGWAQTTAPALPLTLAVGAKAAFSVRSMTRQGGAFNDTLYVNTNDGRPNKTPLRIAVNGTGIYPHLTANDTANFPKWRAFTPYLRTFTINNTGTDVLTINAATIAGPDASNFVINGTTFPFTIAAGSSGTIALKFTPSSADPKVATMSITSDDSQYVVFNQPKVVQFSGTGIYPHISAANSITFPFTVVDIRTSNTSWVVNNTGTDTLSLTGATFAGPNLTEFSIVSPAFPSKIAPGGTGVITAKFAPLVTLGARVGNTMRVTSNFDSISPFPVSITATAVDGAPEMVYAPFVDMGRVHVGTNDTVRYVIQNTLNATKKLIINGGYVLGGDFASQYSLVSPPTMPDTVGIPGTRTLTFVFHPTITGVLPANLRIAGTNASPLPIDIPVIGTGVKGALNISSLAFGRVATSNCVTKLVSVQNVGTDPVTITRFQLIGANSGSYTVVGQPTGTIDVNQTLAFDLKFCPVDVGSKDVVARFITSDGDTTLVNVSGSGANPGNLQVAQTVQFGLIAIQQSLDRTITATNSGDVALTITDVSIVGLAPVPFTTDIVTPLTIDPGASTTFHVVFNSPVGGDFTAAMKLKTDDNQTTTVNLAGSATPDPFAAAPNTLFDNDPVVFPGQTQGTVYLKNFTKNGRQVVDIWIAGRDANAFRIVYPFTWPYTIDPQSGDSIIVKFQPPHAGVFFAQLFIALDGGDTLQPRALNGYANTTGVNDGATPGAFTLSQNYPNPFTTATALQYTLPARADVSLVLFDVMGRALRTLDAGMRDAGSHPITVDATGMPAGLYYYELRVNGATQGRVMQVVK